MFSLRSLGVVVISGLLLGCQQTKSTPSASVGTSTGGQTLQGVRASFQAANPNSRVGVVNAVLPNRHLVSIADLPLNEIQEGDVLSILNEQGRDLVEGEVLKKTDRWVQVRYMDLPAGQRDPRPGDLAAWIPGGARVVTSESQRGNAINPAAPARTDTAAPTGTEPQPTGTEPQPAAPPPATEPAAQPTEPPAANPAAAETMPAQPADATATPAANPTEPPATQPAAADVGTTTGDTTTTTQPPAAGTDAQPPATQPADQAAPADTQPAAAPETQPAATDSQAPAPADTQPAGAGTGTGPDATQPAAGTGTDAGQGAGTQEKPDLNK
jgi:hypothetical protein